MTKLVLASQSEWRKKLLDYLELPFEVRVSEMVEQQEEDEEPAEMVVRLAREKAEVVSRFQVLGDSFEERFLVIGADTVIEIDGVVVGKPVDEQDARRIINLLQGRSHKVLTGLCVMDVDTGEIRLEVDESRLKLLPMTHEQIEVYLQTGEWQGKAGGYQVQKSIAHHIAEIEGSVSNIIGLPLTILVEMLEGFGCFVEVEVREIEDRLKRGVFGE